jgi:GTP cyclohydrolase III
MQSYIYTAQRGRLSDSIKNLSCYSVQFIGGCLKARTPLEAYNNARLLVRERGGNVSQLLVNRL